MTTTYRKPAVTIIQEFVGLQPQLGPVSLPSVCVGPAYQIIDDDMLGTYDATSRTYDYAGLMAGAVVDLDKPLDDEIFPITKKPILCSIKDALVEIVSEQAQGSVVDNVFTDLATNIFMNVLAGDIIKIIAQIGIQIIDPQTDGVTTDTVGQRNRLVPGVADQFSNVKDGDVVNVTGGTNTNTGAFTVLAKVNSNLLLLSGDVNDGGGVSSDVEYNIIGDRGVETAGDYKVRSVTDVNNLEMESPFLIPEAPLKYSILRNVDEIILQRVDSLPANGYLPKDVGIELPALLTFLINESDYEIKSGVVYAEYRGLRNDMASNIKEFTTLDTLYSHFGLDQITPANPLAYGIFIMLSNTVTPVNGLALDDKAASDEALSYLRAFDILEQTEMYAISIMTHNGIVHQQLKTHVEGMSGSAKNKWRVGFINTLLITEEVAKDQATTSESLTNARVIVNTQIDGEALVAEDTKLSDATPDQFINVKKGDSLIIVNGTNVIVGTREVVSKIDNNNIEVDSAIVTGDTSDIQYHIQRKDGLGADGITFYDRDANLIEDGIMAGFYIRFIAGPLAGVYKITKILSNKLAEIEQVPGVAELQSGITYEIYRELELEEQADVIRGYSESFGSRRIVSVWPDIVIAPVGASAAEYLPGYYGGCSIAAMTSGLPSQQGFSNLEASGFLGGEHVSGYFKDGHLDTIASGGTMIMDSEGENQPLYIRHQLTTDRSAIKYQEYSVTKNVDFISKFIKKTYSPMPGVSNIVDTTKDEVRTVAKGIITFLKDETRLPKIGGKIKSGILTKVEEDAVQIDKLRARFEMDIPIPLNELEVTIAV